MFNNFSYATHQAYKHITHITNMLYTPFINAKWMHDLTRFPSSPRYSYTYALKPSCDAPNPGCPLTTRQPAEIYRSLFMRPIPVQKWSLGPTHPTHKMYILYKNELITICSQLYLLQFIQNRGSLAQNFTKTKYKIRPSWPFLRL